MAAAMWSFAVRPGATCCVFREKSKKWSEQMAALVCLCAVGEFDSTTTNHTSPLSLASSRLAVDFDFSPPITDSSVSPSSLPIQSSTASQSHKRLKLTPPTDTPTANHVTAGVSACSGAVLEIVRQNAIQTVDTDVHDVS